MDPLTHTLVGANLAATRLGATTRLSGAALVVGANLPDVDAILYFTGHTDLALDFRRGWTHGVLALVVLPFLLTAILLLYDRLRPDPQRRADPRWLLPLSALAIATHPALDWLNTYGMRWLMPFRGTWFYGDSVYIMDPWIWLILGVGWLAGRRASPALLILWLFFTLAVAWVVGRRSAEYLAVVAVIAVILLLALLWKTPEGDAMRRKLATVALIVTAVYIGGRLTVHALTVSAARDALQRAGVTPVVRIMAGPHPIDPTRWDIVAQSPTEYRAGSYRWTTRRLELRPERMPVPQPRPEWIQARKDPSIRGLIGWIRFPWYDIDHSGGQTRVRIHDARSAARGWRPRAVVVVK